MTPDAARPGAVYWIAAIVLLLWALGGASIYVSLYFEGVDRFARTAETAENSAAYAEYIADIPWWALGAGIIAAVARLLGAICLLLRLKWARTFYVVSAVFFAVALVRAFLFADAVSVMNAAHVGVEVAFAGLSLFAVWLSFRHAKTGVLR